jgi:hypothetical protein
MVFRCQPIIKIIDIYNKSGKIYSRINCLISNDNVLDELKKIKK